MLEAKTKNARIFARDALDWYVEPKKTTSALLRVEKFIGWTHDPACGQGNIVQACLDAGLNATGSDVACRVGGAPTWFLGETDFLTDGNVPCPTNFICNPPFFKGRGTEAFIRRAYDLADAKIAMFTDIKFLTGKARASGLFRDLRPSRVWVITPRVSCPPGEVLKAGGSATGGTADWVWIIWDKTSPTTDTKVGWLVDAVVP